MKSNKKVALYVRTASEEGGKRNASRQLAWLQEISLERGWTVTATYIDVAIPGDGRQPGLNNLLQDAGLPRSAFDSLLASSRDRLSRRLEASAHIERRIKALVST